jgi:hypothetical protein
MLPRLVRYLERNEPGVHMEVRAADRERATEWLENGEVDFKWGEYGSCRASCASKHSIATGSSASPRKDHP